MPSCFRTSRVASPISAAVSPPPIIMSGGRVDSARRKGREGEKEQVHSPSVLHE